MHESGGGGMTASAHAELQRRTQEILAFSARSMGGAGDGDMGEGV